MSGRAGVSVRSGFGRWIFGFRASDFGISDGGGHGGTGEAIPVRQVRRLSI
jgi:hypothetical protein